MPILDAVVPSRSPGVVFEVISSEPTAEVSNLCERCQHIDFETIFHPRQKITSPRGITLMTLERLQHSDTCPLCHLFVVVALERQGRKTKGHHLQAFNAAAYLGAVTQPSDDSLAIALAVVPGLTGNELAPWKRNAYMERGFILSTSRIARSSSPETDVEGRYVELHFTDYTRLNNWLQDCDSVHEEICAPERNARSLSVPLRCIDCLTRKIYEIDEGSTYFALSYVWGASSSSNTTTGTTWLPSRASQVVEDAIAVVKKLGHRFLWLAEMDRVYANAYACIVAAAGADANYGFVGISRPRLHDYPDVVTRQLRLHPTFPAVSYVLRETVWASRGWTYQEAVLSRRCIFFTERQIYFVCRAMHCCEALVVWSQAVLATSQTAVMSAALFHDEQIEYSRSEVQAFTDHIAEFSRRTLTFEDDVLNAFRGLLSRASFHTLYGIPVINYGIKTDFNIGFAAGLWWQPTLLRGHHRPFVPLKRRSCFPSWTWAGWKGCVYYPFDPSSEVHQIAYDSSGTQFWFRSLGGQLHTIQNLGELAKIGSMMIPEVPYELTIEAKVFRLRFHRPIRPRHPGTVCLCSCHPQSTHPGIVGLIHQSEVPVFFEQPAPESDLYQRVIREEWDCLLLFDLKSLINSYHSQTRDLFLLIVDWDGDVAHRVGNLEIRRNIDDFHKLSSGRRTIRMR
ncbi:HET-domain-containing protein [Ophiobolus disseminans]|uniref:HET-domain-containing protein n=1 Tax=Ophiobolus disseminans TaxID=1469910 RepID=A0A6A6ZGY4_9PLEO|nr:HET-domain-containing protein [Ophiobolus disseminans]